MRASVLACLLALVLFKTVAASDSQASAPTASSSGASGGLPVQGGESLSLKVREAQHEPEFSIIEVEAGPEAGRSPSASLFLLRSLCGVMLEREKKFAVAEQVSEKPIRFKVTFPESAAVEERKGLPRMVLSEANCARINERKE